MMRAEATKATSYQAFRISFHRLFYTQFILQSNTRATQ